MSTRIIIPTRNEAGNVRRLISEIGQYVQDAEIYFVDDSDTLDTMEAAYAASEDFPRLPVNVLYREKSERIGQIVGAIRDGLVNSKIRGTERIVVMDGDGQHDPAYIPQLLSHLAWNDVAIGSRYVKGGSHEGLDGTFRKITSQGATLMAKSLFPRELRGVTDPMSGFFAFNLDKIIVSAIEADGYKVLLEILLTHPDLTKSEVPVVFRDRENDKSKLDSAIMVKYLRQLSRHRRQRAGAPVAVRKVQLENV